LSKYGIRAVAKVRDDKEKLSKLVMELLFIIFISTIIAFLLFIGFINSYPDIKKIKAYTKYDGLDFCFASIYPLDAYYKISVSNEVPQNLKERYEETMRGERLENYEPFSRYLKFHNGEFVSRVY